MRCKFIIPITFPNPGLLFGFIALLLLSPISAQEVKLEKIFNLQTVKGLEHILEPTAVFEDHLGYIWIGSHAGLYKFDGYKTIHYAYDPTQPDKIAGNWIQDITEDNEGNILFGVFGIGLQKLNPATGKFTLYKDKDYGKTSFEKIYNLLYFKKNIYLSTTHFCIFSIDTKKIKYFPDIQNPWNFEVNGLVWSLSRDNNLHYFDEKKDSLVLYDNLGIKSDLIIPPIVVQEKIYLNDGLGNLYSYDYKSKKLEYLNSPNNKALIQRMLAIDNRQIYIIGDQSFEIYDIKKNTFSTPALNNTFANGDYYFYKPYKLKNGTIWFAGDKIYTAAIGDQGIESYTLKSNNKNIDLYTSAILNQWNNQKPVIGLSFLLDFENQRSERVCARYPQLSVFDSAYTFGTQYVKTYYDKNKNTWIAYQQRNPLKTTIYQLYPPDKSIKKIGVVSKPIRTVWGITKIDENLWIGGWGGLLKWNLSDDTETHYKSGKDALSLTSDNIRFVFKDREDDLWISTQNGLNLKKKNQDSFIHYLSVPGDTTSLSLNTTSTITQDSSGIIWIATFGGGVNSFDKKTGKFRWYTTKNGLADNNVNNILIDDFQDVWVSYEGLGISKINPTTGKILNFDKSDGIVSLSEHNSLKMSDGSLIFAGDGFNRIFPDRIKIDTFVPQLLITNLKLHNKDVLINVPDSVLHQNINVTKEITLQYKQNVITLEYAALDMVRADKRQYAYQLIGFDPDWQYVDKKREATYTNLPHGDYIFKVKSSMDEENWSEIKTPLLITILPPWWQTWWAYAIYFAMILFGGWKLHVYQKAKTIKKEREKAQERELEHAREIEIAYTKLGTAHENLKSSQAQLIQSEKMASLGELTAGIAHEIQNPLNFVNNFSEVSNELMVDMVDEVDKGNYDEVKAIALDVQQNLTKINHHGKRASSIVKGMLEHSRKSSGTKEPTDINALADEYLKLVYQSLRAKGKDFNAELSTDLDPNLPKIEVVSQEIGRVLLNLITNAFYAVSERSKKGEEGYKPTVSISTRLIANSPTSQHANTLIIAVKDNGPGIPAQIKDKIFQPFFTTKPTGQGTGLGLSLSYDIVKAHGGTLEVKTNEGEGSAFTIQIPLS